MSVLIKGMEKPEHCGYCRFRYGGICHALQKTQYSMNECPLVVIDDAGLNDTISRQAAIKAICEDGTWLESQGCTEISMAERKQRDADILSDLPSVERKKGEWIIEDTLNMKVSCSSCGFVLDDWIQGALYRYCPNCGAWMEGENDATD